MKSKLSLKKEISLKVEAMSTSTDFHQPVSYKRNTFVASDLCIRILQECIASIGFKLFSFLRGKNANTVTTSTFPYQLVIYFMTSLCRYVVA